MPRTLTLQDILDAIHERLLRSARAHGCSLEDEALRCLSAARDLRQQIPASLKLARARAIRVNLAISRFTSHDVDHLKRLGRA